MHKLKYTLNSYWLVYSKRLKKILYVIGLVVLLQLAGAVLRITELKQDDTTWLRSANAVVVRYDQNFQIHDQMSKKGIEPISAEVITVAVDADDFFGEARRSLLVNNYEKVTAIEKSASQVIGEIDFYLDGKLQGTILMFTPRTEDGVAETKTRDHQGIWQTFDGKPVSFYKGGKYFTFWDGEIILDNLEKLLALE